MIWWFSFAAVFVTSAAWVCAAILEASRFRLRIDRRIDGLAEQIAHERNARRDSDERNARIFAREIDRADATARRRIPIRDDTDRRLRHLVELHFTQCFENAGDRMLPALAGATLRYEINTDSYVFTSLLADGAQQCSAWDTPQHLDPDPGLHELCHGERGTWQFQASCIEWYRHLHEEWYVRRGIAQALRAIEGSREAPFYDAARLDRAAREGYRAQRDRIQRPNVATRERVREYVDDAWTFRQRPDVAAREQLRELYAQQQNILAGATQAQQVSMADVANAVVRGQQTTTRQQPPEWMLRHAQQAMAGAQRLYGQGLGPEALARVGMPYAEERGIELLRKYLDPEQLREFNEHQYFHVIGSRTGRRYCIKFGRSMNVFYANGWHPLSRGICFNLGSGYCAGDTMLAQKLTLECEEDRALALAQPFG